MCTWRLAINSLDGLSAVCGCWRKTRSEHQASFGRQAIPMVWDYAEAKPVWERRESFKVNLAAIRSLTIRWSLAASPAVCVAAARCRQTQSSASQVVSTDPPYYDNIGYADLSDFFYVWLRRSLKPVFPRPLRHARRAEGRGAGRHALSPRQQREGGGVLPRRHDAGDAPPRRAGASGLPGHHLLRLQAVGERRARRAPPAPAGRPSSTR